MKKFSRCNLPESIKYNGKKYVYLCGKHENKDIYIGKKCIQVNVLQRNLRGRTDLHDYQEYWQSYMTPEQIAKQKSQLYLICTDGKVRAGAETNLDYSFYNEVTKSDAYWISAWILEKKNIQYSTKKEAWFDEHGNMLPTYHVQKHVPEKKEVVNYKPIKELQR